MFNESLSKYTVETIRKEGIEIKTAHHDKISVRYRQIVTGEPHEMDPKECLTLHSKEEGDVGVGMSIWTTGNTTTNLSRILLICGSVSLVQ